MKIGISSWTYIWAAGVSGYPMPEKKMDIISLVKKAAEYNLHVVQIADNMPITGTTINELNEAVTIANDNDIEIEIGTKGLLTENLLDHIGIAKTTNSRLIRTLPHTANHRPEFSEATNLLKKIEPYLIENDIQLAIENHDFYSSSWLRNLIEAVASPNIGICLDAVNNIGQGESFNEVIDNLGKYTLNFHCKDYTIRRKPSMLGFDVTGCPAGQGMLDLEKAKSLLPVDISWIIELWTPWQGDIGSTVAFEASWAEQSVINLLKA